MLRTWLSRAATISALVLVLLLAGLTTSCGGGGGYAAKDMVLVNFLFVDRSLNPTAPTGTQNLPRNAQLSFEFSEQVDPQSVTPQTIQVRYSGQKVPTGSFRVDGPRVFFDPTVTAQGQPNPFGFEPLTQYTVDIPNYEEQASVLRNLDNDPNLVTFFTTFVTADGYLRELVPPSVVRVYWIPAPNAQTGQIPGNGLAAVVFSEPMDPATFLLGGPAGPTPSTSIDFRYVPTSQINKDNGLVTCTSGPDVNSCPEADLIGAPIPGYFTHNPGATEYYFNPSFSFGDKTYDFTIQLFQNLKDLSGNRLINPRSFGPYNCDGKGRTTGKFLIEDFDSTTDGDFFAGATDADWGFLESGILQGQPITSRNAYIFGYKFVDPTAVNTRTGQYAATTDPLVGAKLNQVPGWPTIPGTPPTADGRRVMWAFSDEEMGADGTVTAAAWGPDSNALFAAIYPAVTLQCGYQKTASMGLGAALDGNYAGTPVVVYTGSYTVTQAANIGNTPGHPTFPHNFNYTEGPGCSSSTNFLPSNPCYQLGWNCPLFMFTGFAAWPTFTTYFDWDDGNPTILGDAVFLFDAAVAEGDTWQQLRAYFAVNFPCGWALQGGFANRRVYTTESGDTADPPTNTGVGVYNPEPSITDSCFTITKRTSVAQTLWYTDNAQTSGASSLQQTFGTNTDYLVPLINPSVQSGGATVRIEFQGATAVEADRRTLNQAAPFTPWTENINDCDGFPCLRWRVLLFSNLVSQTKARLDTITIPMQQL